MAGSISSAPSGLLPKPGPSLTELNDEVLLHILPLGMTSEVGLSLVETWYMAAVPFNTQRLLVPQKKERQLDTTKREPKERDLRAIWDA